MRRPEDAEPPCPAFASDVRHGAGELPVSYPRVSDALRPDDHITAMNIRVFATTDELSRHAATQAADILLGAIAAKGRARLVAATGNTQFAFLQALVASPGVDWSRVELFHLDEYIGLPATHPGSFCRFMRERLMEPAGIERAHLIDGMGHPSSVIANLTVALRRAPIDLTITGIGENGHLAFNEPPADFGTTDAFKVVALDEISRRQQVGEQWFADLADVPTHAITMTVPEILKARDIVCLAHGLRKARAVAACFNGPVSPDAPASALATHGRTTVYLDSEAASLLRPHVTVDDE